MLFFLLFSIGSHCFADEMSQKKKCKNVEVSCDGVEGAKREYFCAKKQVSEKRKEKLCKKAPRKRMAKKKKQKKIKKEIKSDSEMNDDLDL